MEVTPLHAVMEVEIEGESSVFGNEAFKKSKEVSNFVSELGQVGYDSENISLENVSIETSTGKFTRSSSAVFTLNLDKIEIHTIPQILAVISVQKNIEIGSLDYEFGDLRAQKAELLVEACASAKKQAESIGAAFGVPLLSVYSMNPKWTHPDRDATNHRVSNSGVRMSKSLGPRRQELEGLDFVSNHKGRLRLNMKVEFRVGEFVDGS